MPGRCEPGTGEINYPAVARALDEIGYRGTVGLEAFASSDSELALQAFPGGVQPRLTPPPHRPGQTRRDPPMATLTAPLDFDPLRTDFQRQDPFDAYRRLRDEAPVYYSEKWSWWALSRYDDVRNAVLDPATYLSFEGIDIDDTAKDQSGPGFLPDLDNPRHDQIRRVIQPYFLPRRIAEQKQNVQRVVRGLVDGWRSAGRSTWPPSCPGRCPTRCSSGCWACPTPRPRAAAS